MKFLTIPILIFAFSTGCVHRTPGPLTPTEVTVIFEAAQWGVQEAVSLEYLSTSDGRLFSDIVSTVQSVIAKNPSGAVAAGKAALSEAEMKLPVDSKLRPYIDGALALLH